MSIVKPSDFIGGKIKIANVAQSDVAADLDIFITDYEKELLIKLLGKTLYAELIVGLGEDPVLEKWTALVEQMGVSIANYIYWFYMGDNNTQTVAMGAVQAKSANAVSALPDEKMIRAWNEMVRLSIETVKFIKDNPTDYGDYYIENFYYLGWFNSDCHKPDIFYTVNWAGI